jgi:anti-sigma factor RsiW
MNCVEAEVLIHALIDGEIDAGHARDIEIHVAGCPACAGRLEAFRAMREAIRGASLREVAPAYLRSRIETSLPLPPARKAAWFTSQFTSWRTSRRTFFAGFALGTAFSAAVAATLVIAILHDNQEQSIASEVVSAHLRSLRAGHLTDVETSDQHTVKPWFNGKLDVAPPVIDLTAQGFTLVGGRLDYINGEAVAAIVYRRRNHIINLFIKRQLRSEYSSAKIETMQGFNVRHWTLEGLDFRAISDINEDELTEFSRKFAAALGPAAGLSWLVSGANKG